MRTGMIRCVVAALAASAFLAVLAGCGGEPGADSSCNRASVRTAVETAAEGLGAVLKNISGEERRLQCVRDYVNACRFFKDRTGHFFVYSMLGVAMAHPKNADLVGKNLFTFMDGKFKEDVRKCIKAAEEGGGFVVFSLGDKDKIAYVKAIPDTAWFIGGGFYDK